jgi:hypothetical protein
MLLIFRKLKIASRLKTKIRFRWQQGFANQFSEIKLDIIQTAENISLRQRIWFLQLIAHAETVN